jgi:HAD superfamily hydrolase (TIGR01549 family)
MRTPKAVLFDWDGTLLDSAEASFRSFGRLFGSYSLPFDREAFERTYFPDWYRTYEAMGLAPAHWEEADRRWLGFYTEEPAQLLPGARAALERLVAAGIPLGLVTSGERERVVADLKRVELGEFFASIVCGTDLAARKPDPAPLRRGLGELGVAPGDAAYVGDSPDDVAMARAAGVFAIAVAGGYPNRTALLASGADLFAESLHDALAWMGVP